MTFAWQICSGALGTALYTIVLLLIVGAVRTGGDLAVLFQPIQSLLCGNRPASARCLREYIGFSKLPFVNSSYYYFIKPDHSLIYSLIIILILHIILKIFFKWGRAV